MITYHYRYCDFGCEFPRSIFISWTLLDKVHVGLKIIVDILGPSLKSISIGLGLSDVFFQGTPIDGRDTGCFR